MPEDVSLTMGVRTDRLDQDLRNAEGKVRGSANRMAQQLAGAERSIEQSIATRPNQLEKFAFGTNRIGPAVAAGVTAAFATAYKAVKKYAEVNDDAKAAMDRMEGSADRLQKTVGRSLTPTFMGFADALQKFERSGGVDWIVRLASPLVVGPQRAVFDSAAGDSLRAGEEQKMTFARVMGGTKALRDAAVQFQRDALAGDPLGLARYRLGEAQRTATEEAGRIFTGPEQIGQRERFIMLRTEALRQEVRLLEQRERLEQQQNERESRRAINDRLNKTLGERVEKRDRELSAGRVLRLEEQMTRAQELRLKGRDREADQLEIQAQFEKRIKDVQDSDFSSPGEANRYRGRLRMLMGDQLRLLGMTPPDRTATVGPGGYSAGIGRVAFGNGLGPGAAGASPEAELKKANKTLQDISQKLDRRGATFN